MGIGLTEPNGYIRKVLTEFYGAEVVMHVWAAGLD